MEICVGQALLTAAALAEQKNTQRRRAEPVSVCKKNWKSLARRSAGLIEVRGGRLPGEARGQECDTWRFSERNSFVEGFVSFDSFFQTKISKCRSTSALDKLIIFAHPQIFGLRAELPS